MQPRWLQIPLLHFPLQAPLLLWPLPLLGLPLELLLGQLQMTQVLVLVLPCLLALLRGWELQLKVCLWTHLPRLTPALTFVAHQAQLAAPRLTLMQLLMVLGMPL